MFDINQTLNYIEIETCSSCTRACKWCLFGNVDNFRDKTNTYLETKYIEDVFNDLSQMNFSGTIALYSMNEPLLDERVPNGELIKLCKNYFNCKVCINIVTNGDLLNPNIVESMYNAGLDKLIVSCYDDQSYSKITNLRQTYKAIKILDQRRYITGQWESNRAGSIDSAKNIPISHNSCYMPFFRTVIGWDGEVRLCCHDAVGKAKFGNIKNEKLSTILNSKEFTDFRTRLVNERSNIIPCKDCNVDGSLNYMMKHLNGIQEKLLV